NALSILIFEQRWENMIKTFPECQSYMTRTLYNNRISWAKAYLLSQFNAGIQSTQSVESFNSIIKKSLNSASTLCDVEEAINKRHEQETRYCQLTNIRDSIRRLVFRISQLSFFQVLIRSLQNFYHQSYYLGNVFKFH